jgi:hypothetical protein
MQAFQTRLDRTEAQLRDLFDNASDLLTAAHEVNTQSLAIWSVVRSSHDQLGQLRQVGPGAIAHHQWILDVIQARMHAENDTIVVLAEVARQVASSCGTTFAWMHMVHIRNALEEVAQELGVPAPAARSPPAAPPQPLLHAAWWIVGIGIATSILIAVGIAVATGN